MTNAHFHRGGYEAFLLTGGREVRFFGVHPWQAGESGRAAAFGAVRAALAADPGAGVGEIGLDRLRAPRVDDAQRELFGRQLELAAELRRVVALHGAKCWGEVVRQCRPYAGRIPAFLFHGFSRADGLLPEIVALNGFVSVGPAVLNDHAVNYRALVRKIPRDRLLVETDAAADVRIETVFAKVEELTGIDEAALDRNAERMLGS